MKTVVDARWFVDESSPRYVRVRAAAVDGLVTVAFIPDDLPDQEQIEVARQIVMDHNR